MDEVSQTIQEKVYIIQPATDENARALEREAVSLIESAGALHAGSAFQTIRKINPSTYIGEGKLQEIAEHLEGLDVTVLFNGELSPSQAANISHALGGKKVIDRTALILDIFAKNAKSSEGKLQVELAQLQYLVPRLKGKGTALSRLGGGIGTRGPGETKLETDRRRIRMRIDYLEEKIRESETRRKLFGERRKKTEARTISLIGYTNTGKSTLLNLLTDADVLAENRLFATLDPTTRKMTIDGNEFLVTDTVGFLRELPHHLISAFKSTLESALGCDLALIVCDATDDYAMQLQTTLSILKDLDCNVPYKIVMNKCENLLSLDDLPADSICISAKHNIGIAKLKAEILQFYSERYREMSLLIPYAQMGAYSRLKQYCDELSSEYRDDGLHVRARVSERNLKKFLPFRAS